MKETVFKTKRLTTLAFLTTVALVLSLIESALPPLTSVPGVKLGLANIVTLAVFYLYGRRDALIVLICRVLLAAIAGGRIMSLPYSLTGGLMCYALCALLYPVFPLKRMWLLSMIGAVMHNIGQIAAAIVITGTPAIIWYLPVLMISGLVTGFFTGQAAGQMLMHMRKIIPEGPA